MPVIETCYLFDIFDALFWVHEYMAPQIYLYGTT